MERLKEEMENKIIIQYGDKNCPAFWANELSQDLRIIMYLKNVNRS